jgi:chromodomain-helicase-DNA-binding protein 1
VLSKKQKQRRRDVLNGNAPPTTAEVRFSTRQRNAITYNEDEEGMNDDLIDEDAVMEWVEDTSPYVDRVLYHRLPEGMDWKQEGLNKTDFEYLVKWQGLSSIHATWELWDTLKGFRGFKKVQNYAVHEKTGVNLHIAYMTIEELPPDDKENFLVNYELVAEQVASQNKPERIIGSQVVEGETQYFVKWKGQDYDQCSWEFANIFDTQPEESKELFQKAIDDFIERNQNIPKSTKLTTRPQFKRFTEQPDYIKFGTLRDFQLDGLNRLCLHWTGGHNIMLADEMGLGKTIQTVSFLNFLRHDRNQQGPFLVCVPLSTMGAWADTFDNWTPDVNYIVYHGNKESLNVIQQYELLKDGKPRFNVLLSTYETVNRNVSFLRTFKWQYLAVDEAHRLKNSESQLYETLLSIHFDAKLLITGTPMQNNLLELKSLMDFLMPGVIQVDPKLDLTDLEGAADQLAQLRTDISRYMIRRTKQNVMKELPPKTEKVLRVDLSDLQAELCKNITLRNYDALNKGVQGQKVSLSNILMELKKASNHPFLFPAAEERYWRDEQSRDERLRDIVVTSGKMMLLDKLLVRLKQEGHRVLIFSQMVKVLTLLAEYLRLRGHKYQQLDGTTAAAARRAAIERFNAKDSDDFCFLLSTRAGGLGINLMTADTVVIFDSDWNPHADLQAMGRAHRIGQTKPVTIYRLVSADSIEEKILEAAKNKLILEYVTIQKGGQEKELQEQAAKKGVILGGEKGPSREDMARILKFGATKLFQPSADNQSKLESLDIDAVLASAEEHNTEMPDGAEEVVDDNDDFLKAFEVTDVKIDDLGWDEIVPQDEVKRLQDEENERKTQEMIKSLAGDGPRQRKKPGEQSTEERNHRAAKKRARDAQREAAADVEESDDTEADPKRPLNESETRRLLKAYQQWGSFEEMQEKIIETAKLTKRDPELVRATIQQIVDKSKAAIAEEQKRLDGLDQGKITKKERKEVLIEFNGVKRNNATTMVERPAEMKLIRTSVESYSDQTNFRIPEAMKPAQDFTCNWTAREDGMLIKGIAKYGWGSWWEIRDDPELDMKDKCFLEEQRTANKDARKEGGGDAEAKARKPTQVHLNRRANYLVSVLKAKASGDLDSLENHHRNIKKSTIPEGASVPGMPRRIDKPRHRAHSSADPRQRFPSSVPRDTPDAHRRKEHSHHKSHHHRPDSSHRTHHSNDLKRRHDDLHHHSHDPHKRPRTDLNGSPAHHLKPQSSHHKSSSKEKKGPRDQHADERTQELMAPVMPYLDIISKGTRDQSIDKKEKVMRIKTNTLRIGDWINAQEESRKERYWEYLGHRCFSGSSAGSMKSIYSKMAAERGAGGGGKTVMNGGANGSGEPATNGVKKEVVVTPSPAPIPTPTPAPPAAAAS